MVPLDDNDKIVFSLRRSKDIQHQSKTCERFPSQLVLSYGHVKIYGGWFGKSANPWHQNWYVIYICKRIISSTMQ